MSVATVARNRPPITARPSGAVWARSPVPIASGIIPAIIAMAVTNGEKRTIVVQDLASEQVVLRADTGDVKVRRIQWAGEGHLLIVTSVTDIRLIWM